MALCRRIFASSVGAVLAVNLIQPFVFLLSCSPVKLLSDAFAYCAWLEFAQMRFYVSTADNAFLVFTGANIVQACGVQFMT